MNISNIAKNILLDKTCYTCARVVHSMRDKSIACNADTVENTPEYWKGHKFSENNTCKFWKFNRFGSDTDRDKVDENRSGRKKFITR